MFNTDRTVRVKKDGDGTLVRTRQNVYENIVEEWKTLIELGAVAVGERLPSVRSFALERGVNPNTVDRAYVELERQGYVKIFPKKGAYVVDRGLDEREEAIKQAVLAWKRAGVAKETLEKIVAGVFENENYL